LRIILASPKLKDEEVYEAIDSIVGVTAIGVELDGNVGSH
jgi:hypothetical protein